MCAVTEPKGQVGAFTVEGVVSAPSETESQENMECGGELGMSISVDGGHGSQLRSIMSWG